MRHFDPETLAAFVAVVDTGSFTAAAARLGKTQAAISIALTRFEERLGRRLLERKPRGVRLTDAGETLIGYARRMLALEDEAFAALWPEEVAGRLRIGMPDDYQAVFGPALITRFAAENPRVRLEIICDFSERLEPMVAAGNLDLAIVTRERGSAAGELLRREPLAWCAAVGAAPEQLDPLPLALFPEHCRARPRILAALDKAGRRWRIAWTSSHLPSIESAVTLGIGVTALPESVVGPTMRRLGPADGLPPLEPLELAVITGELAGPAARRLRTFVRTSFGRPDPAAAPPLAAEPA
jgi:DNA-binding transcriptional LysR family regulator